VTNIWSNEYQIHVPTVKFMPATVAPKIIQTDDATSGITADNLSAIAQGVSTGDGNATSGNFLLRGGRGTGGALNKDGNIALHEVPASWQIAEEVCFISDRVADPTGNPAAGGFLIGGYNAVTGLLAWRDPSGGISSVGPAIYRKRVALDTAADHPYAVLSTDYVIGVDSTGGAFTINLPAAAGMAGRHLLIKDEAGTAAASNITIDANAGEFIDGALTAVLSVSRASLSLYCDGTGWMIY